MSNRLRIVRQVVDWPMVFVMLLIGSIDLGAWANRGIDSFLPTWQGVLVCAARGIWALTPVLAAFLVLGARKWAGWVWLVGSPVVFLWTGQCVWKVSFGELGGRSTAFGIVLMALAIVPCAYWLVTSALRWPPVFAATPQSGKSKRFAIAFCALVVVLLTLASTAVLAAVPMFFGDCGGLPPFAKPRNRWHAAFVANDAFRFGTPPVRTMTPPWVFDHLAIARVREHFWGLPWWSRKFVLLVDDFSWHGETYFVDASRPDGILAQFLPVVVLNSCGRSNLLSHAELELRLLRDGQSKRGARVIGYVERGDGMNSEKVAAIKMTLSGPSGDTTRTSDAQGIFDFPGLPPGNYTLHPELPTPTRLQNSGSCFSSFQLAPGEIYQCDTYFK